MAITTLVLLTPSRPGAQPAPATQPRLAQPAADLPLLLPLIGRLAQYPAATLLAVPATPEQALRGVLLLRGLSRQIAQDAAAAQAADQAAHAQTLASAIATVADQPRRDRPLTRPSGEAGEKLIPPVAGIVIRAFGDATDSGPANGISYRPAPAARVVSPCGGKVVFSGPFRSFGLLLIIDCGGGTHVVLAGLDRLDVPVGRQVQAGEPVGVMPAGDPHSIGERPLLYVELRRNGTPVNPVPWLRTGG